MTVPEHLEEPLRRAAETIASADEIACAGHIGPDGDALGSSLGLALAARKVGKRSVVSFGSPFGIADNYRYLDLAPVVPPDRFPAEPEVMVAFDVGSDARLGELAEPARRAGTLIVVDHHLSNGGFGDIAIIDPTAAASAQLCFYLIEALGWPLDAAVATALHTGLVTDTGRFQYSNTRPETLRVAARLVEAGARPEVIGQHLYEEVPFGLLHVEALVLGRARLEADLRLVWSVLYQDDLRRHGIGMEDTDPLIDLVRVAREADVAALLKERAGGGFKVSLRSRGRVDVAAIASRHGGGGHHNAAGFTVLGGEQDAVAAVVAGLREVGG